MIASLRVGGDGVPIMGVSLNRSVRRRMTGLPGSSEATQAPAKVERFVKQLLIAYRAVILYPPASNIPAENARLALETLSSLLSDDHDVRLTIAKDGLSYHGTPVLPGRDAFTAFSRELYNHGLAEVRFHPGLTHETLVAFLGVLGREPDQIDGAEGFAAQLWEAGVDTITVTGTSKVILEGDEGDIASGPDIGSWPPSPHEIDEALPAALEGVQPELALLTRVLQAPEIVREYLSYGFSAAGPEKSPEEAARGVKVAELAHLAHRLEGDVSGEAMECLSAAVEMLPGSQRYALLAQRLLTEARMDTAAAELVGHMGIEDVCRALVSEAGTSEVSTEGLARAIRNLALAGLASRDEVLEVSGTIMSEAGLAQETVESVLEAAAPRKLVVKDEARVRVSGERGSESVLRLIDLAVGTPAGSVDDPEREALVEEVERGIGDAEVMGALVTLVTSEVSAEQLSETMMLLEEGLALLVGSGEYRVAADAAEALLSAAAEGDEEKRLLLADAAKTLAGRDQMEAITRAMGSHPKGGPEHEACARLLSTLGDLTIGPLLEVLADEPEMAVRKSIVETISQIAGDHIMELAARLGDPRWYFVRNIVTILGSTRRPEAVSAMSRTVRHPDARVRRETIRALAGIHDRRATEMLAACLEDTDAGNVQLAARYLGNLRARAALPALHLVALGEGKGNREPGPRAEAIEALGAIGSEESVPVLKTVMRKGIWRGPKRSKLLRNAATAALESIQASKEEKDS